MPDNSQLEGLTGHRGGTIYDYIVVFGGTAGAMLAERRSARSGSQKGPRA
jgi:hypothetical protein